MANALPMNRSIIALALALIASPAFADGPEYPPGLFENSPFPDRKTSLNPELYFRHRIRGGWQTFDWVKSGSAAANDWPRIGNASTTRRSPSCASLPSASCCENYAIPHDILGQTQREIAARPTAIFLKGRIRSASAAKTAKAKEG
jgi:hypothetical protein